MQQDKLCLALLDLMSSVVSGLKEQTIELNSCNKLPIAVHTEAASECGLLAELDSSSPWGGKGAVACFTRRTQHMYAKYVCVKYKLRQEVWRLVNPVLLMCRAQSGWQSSA